MNPSLDPAVVAANVYKPVLENARVRVFDVNFAPAAKAVAGTTAASPVPASTHCADKITCRGPAIWGLFPITMLVTSL